MKSRGIVLAVILLLGPAIAGCVSNSGSGTDDGHSGDSLAFTRCEHPWPCADGSEWPADLVAPTDGFDIAALLPIRVPMSDGVELDGAVWMPTTPAGVKLPVILWVTPYAGQCRDNPSCDDPPSDSEKLGRLFRLFWSQGYAAAAVSLRGTGLSGGCFDYYGAPSQRDLSELVTWFGDQSWSNGRVGMWGISAMGTTPWMAAIGSPPALKAIAPSGIISDFYLNRFTPQGAPDLTAGAFQVNWGTLNSPAPPGGAVTGQSVANWPDSLATIAQNYPERLCPEVAEWETAAARAQYTDDRLPEFWEERRLVKDFANVTAAVLVQHGFLESGHAFQDDAIWPTLENAPRRMFLGQWGHVIFPDDQLADYPGGESTEEVLLTWFDFWLKGIGDPPRVGVVDYQIGDGPWEDTTSWPPADARDEVIYLADEKLHTEPGGGVTLRATQTPERPVSVGQLPCETEGQSVGSESPRIVLATEPAKNDSTLAGNAIAYLELTSDQPGGIIAVDLYRTDPEVRCGRWVAGGAADLRFHAGNSAVEPFPVGAPTWVRVDLSSFAVRLPVGEQLFVVLSGSGNYERSAQPQYAPELQISGASHLVLPVTAGTMGGAPPTLEYPPRPRI